MMRIFFLCLSVVGSVEAQFDPPAGQPGSRAVPHNSPWIVGWATHCSVERGAVDISRPELGWVSMGAETDALGAAGDGATLSLGDGGSATLTFGLAVRNGPGPDLVVFENAFNDTFLELAFVEVSSDGQHFVRFPSVSNTPADVQIGTFGAVDARHLHNLAGKYRAGYGTPFDLEELHDSAGLDLEHITHVRVIDVVGCIQPAYARYDSRGQVINDPWNTPFEQGGFDLDAVGILNAAPLSLAQAGSENACSAPYPNPAAPGGVLFLPAPVSAVTVLYDAVGRAVLHIPGGAERLELPLDLPAGWYVWQGHRILLR